MSAPLKGSLIDKQSVAVTAELMRLAAPAHRLVRRVRFAIRASLSATGLAILAAAIGAVLLIGSAWDLVDPLSDALRYFAFACIATTALVAAWAGFRPLARRLSDTVVARQIEATLPNMHNRLVSVVELTGTLPPAQDGASPVFLRRLIRETEARLGEVRTARVIDLRRMLTCLAMAGCVGAVLALFAFSLGERFSTAAQRLLAPWQEIAPDTGVRIVVEPGDSTVLYGDSVELAARIAVGFVDRLIVEIVDANGRKTLHPMETPGDDQWTFRLPNVKETLSYRIIGGRTWTKAYQITPLPRPEIVRIETAVRYPEYLGIESEIKGPPNVVDVAGPTGSNVAISVTSNGATSRGELVLKKLVEKESPRARRRERVWFAERLPGDAKLTGDWQFRDTASGKSHGSTAAGIVERSLETEQNGFAVGTDEWLFVDATLRAEATPRAVGITFRRSDGWTKRGVFGARFGNDSGQVQLGALPLAGKNVRLEFPAKSLGIDAKNLDGVKFASIGGAWWIHAIGAVEPPTESKASLETFDRVALRRSHDGNWIGAFSLTETIRYAIEIRDSADHANSPMVPAVAKVVPDQPPRVRLDKPIGDLTLAKSMPVPLSLAAEDDFGLATIQLAWWIDNATNEAGEQGKLADAQVRKLERIWFADRLPAGAKASGEWRWDNTGNGTSSHHHIAALNQATHEFTGALAEFRVYPGDKLFAEILIPRDFRPEEIMLGFHDGRDWEHRAFWGADRIGSGQKGRPSRKRVGDLPGLGEWFRLEVPASALGLEGKVLRGMAFTSWGGTFKTRKVGAISTQRPVESALDAALANDVPTEARRLVLRRYVKPVGADRLATVFPVDAIGVPAGGSVSFSIEAYDRKGQVARTKPQRIRVSGEPDAVDRQLARLIDKQRDARRQFDDLLDRQRKIGDALKEIAERIAGANNDATADKSTKEAKSTQLAKDLDALARLQNENHDLAKQLRSLLERSAKMAEESRIVPHELTRQMRSAAQARLADAQDRMKQVADNLKNQAQQKENQTVEPAQQVERQLQKQLEAMKSELEAYANALGSLKKNPSEAMSQMRQAMQQQDGDRAGKELSELSDFAKKLGTALQDEARRQEKDPITDPTIGDQLLSKARQLLDMPDPAEPPKSADGDGNASNPPATKRNAQENFRPAVAESAEEPVDRQTHDAKANSQAKVERPSKEPSSASKLLNQAGQSLTADSKAVAKLGEQLTKALERAKTEPAPLRQLLAAPGMQRALAMAGRMRMMQMEAMAQTQTKSSAQSKPGKVGQAGKVGKAGSIANRNGNSQGVAADEVLGQLDIGLQNALMKLQPKLREQILEGIREQGPEAWRPIIRDYFERLSRIEGPGK